MAESLSPECTPLKHEYDNCFNAWFEGYLEPVVGAKGGPATDDDRARHIKAKTEEYDATCGKLWEGYKECVHRAIADKGLDKLLNDARDENPLTESPPPPESSGSSS